jgi:hypothetical protein
MSEVQDSWKEVAGKAEALGLKLKLHLAQEKSEDPDGESTTESDAKAVVEDLGRKIQEAFDSAGNAAKDPAVHDDVKEMGRLFKDALLATVSTVGQEVQTRVDGATKSADVEDASAEDAVVDASAEVAEASEEE